MYPLVRELAAKDAPIRVARSRNSSGCFLGAPMTLILHGLRASTRPGAIQSIGHAPQARVLSQFSAVAGPKGATLFHPLQLRALPNFHRC